MRNSGDYQFSFSGIKTSVRYFVEKAWRAGVLVESGQRATKDANPDTVTVEDIAASFQAAVVDVLVYKSIRAAKSTSARAITLTGGALPQIANFAFH